MYICKKTKQNKNKQTKKKTTRETKKLTVLLRKRNMKTAATPLLIQEESLD